MVDAATVRRLALALPGATEEVSPMRPGGIAFHVGPKGFAWSYMQRVAKGQPRVLRPEVLAIRCPLERKELLIEAAPEIYFDDDHYRGYPAVLTRLDAIGEQELAAMLAAAWRLQAPPKIRKAAEADGTAP